MNFPRFLETLKRTSDLVDRMMSHRFAVEGVLSDKQMQVKSLLFMRYVTIWLLRVATKSEYTPAKMIKYASSRLHCSAANTSRLPLPTQEPDEFKFLPEYVLENIVSNFNFVFR